MTTAPLLQPAEFTALYVRISDDDAGDALGVARQRKDMTAYAARLGLPVVEFCDNSFSASRYARRKRPAYQEMLRGIEAGEVRHVVFWDLSRLTRQPKELEILIDLAAAGTVEVHSLTGKLDIRDPDGIAMARVVCAMNAKSSDDTSKRIKRQQEQARAAGKFHGGGRAFGFEPDGTVRTSEAALLSEAATRVLAGEGLLTITKAWMARGVTAPNGGKEIRRKMVRDALLRPRTAQAGIVTPEEQEELRAVLMDPRRKLSATNVRSHLLSGLLTCSFCGNPMRSKPRNRKPSYACDHAGCRKVASLTDPVDDLVRDALLYRLDGPGLAQARQERAKDDPEARSLVQALEGYEGRLSALEGDYLEGGLDLATFKRMKTGFEVKIAEARRSLASRTERRVLASIPSDLAGWWESATLDQRRSLITAVVESITVGPTQRGRQTFDVDRVTIAWRF